MTPDDVYELAWAADPRISPDGTTVAFAVIPSTARRTTTAARSSRAGRPLGAAAKPDRRREARRSPRWSPDGQRARLRLEPRRRSSSQLYVIPCRRRGAPAHRSEGERARAGLVARRHAPRVRRRACPIRSTRRRTRASRAPHRFTRLCFKLDDEGWTGDRRTAALRRRRRRLGRAGPADGGRLRVHAPRPGRPTASRSRSSRRATTTGTSSSSPTSTRCRRAAETRARSRARTGTARCPAWSPDGALIAFRYTPGSVRRPAARAARGRARRGRRAARAQRRARPQLQPVPADARACLGRRRGRLRRRGLRQRHRSTG